jgi:hypothetical protein
MLYTSQLRRQRKLVYTIRLSVFGGIGGWERDLGGGVLIYVLFLVGDGGWMVEELERLGNWIEAHERCIVGGGYGGCTVAGRREDADERGNDGSASLMARGDARKEKILMSITEDLSATPESVIQHNCK